VPVRTETYCTDRCSTAARILNSGSFIRPSPSIGVGCSFLQALVNKYVEPAHGDASQEKIILGSSNGAIEVEAVDLDKIRGKFANLERLREISLDNDKVSTGSEPGKILSTCPSEPVLPFFINIPRLTSSRHPRLRSLRVAFV
jgi:hypothetical protein